MTFRMPLIALLLLVAPSMAPAEDQGARESSVRKLLVVMESRKMIDDMWPQMEAMMANAIQQALDGQEVSTAQQAILDDMQKEMIALMKEEMTWESYEPMMLDIYQKSFTENEVQGMLEFYRSPAGRAVTAKMPLVMQATVEAMQVKLVPFQLKLRALQEETLAKLKEAAAR